MNSKTVCVLLGLGIGVLKASGLEAMQPYQRPDKSPAQTSTSYTPWRWIGIRSTRTSGCPGIPGFDAEPLLKPRDENRYPYGRQPTIDPALGELGLDRFCVYTANTNSPRKPGILPSGLEAAAPDRMALSAFAEDVLAESDPRIGRVLAAEFLKHIKPSPMQLKGGPDVRITFLDSQPDGDAPTLSPPPGSQHGYTLTHLAQQLVCYGPCAAEIRSRRILGNDKFAPSLLPADQAGTMGLISELGQKIVDTVNELDQPGSPRHLILNLSVGWDGEEQDLLQGLRADLSARRISDLEPAVRSVYLALKLAAQKGVLVIASSGNRRGGSLFDSSWPVLPAAWELRSPSLLQHARSSKLIYAVGGVDWQGLPLPNSRTRGLPKRVAFGDHATAEVGPEENRFTAIYTGTSVSAAVTSAAAAVIWHLRPELRPAEVMAIIDASSECQKAKADFYAWSDAFLRPTPVIREVSLCAAVKRACPTGAQCSETLAKLPRCPLRKREAPPLANILSTLRSPNTEVTPSYKPTAPPPPSPCHPSMLLLTANGVPPSTPLCPTDEFRSVSSQRWVFPQPGDDPCPKCSLFPPPPQVASLSTPDLTPTDLTDSRNAVKQYYSLAIAISPCWIDGHKNTAPECSGTLPLDGKLEPEATLDIDRFDERGVFIKRMTYPVHLDLTGKSWTVSGLGDGQSLFGCRAQLNFVVTKSDGTPLSVQNPVIVDP
jgi:Subtilase family